MGLIRYEVTVAAVLPVSRAYAPEFVLGQDPFAASFTDLETFTGETATQELTGQVDALGRTRAAVFDAKNHKVTSFTDYDGATNTRTYNDFAFPLREIDRAGRVTEYTYDAVGNRLSKTVGSSPAASTWRWEYDARGLMTAAIDANGQRTGYAYYPNGWLKSVTEPRDSASEAPAVRTFTYTTSGQLKTATDAGGRTVTYGYDARNRVISRTYADGSVETITYGAGDFSGLVVATTDRNGALTTKGYDLAGRLVHTEVASGTAAAVSEDCTYASGSKSRKATCTRGGETTAYAYDPRGRQIGMTVSPTTAVALTSTSTYDPKGRITRSQDPYGRTTWYLLDPVGRTLRTLRELVPGGFPFDQQVRALTSSTDPVLLAQAADQVLAAALRDPSVNPAYLIEDTAYDAAGLVTSRTDGRGTVSTMAYDSQGRVVAMTEAAGTPVAATTAYQYDAQGNRLRITDPRGTVTAMTYTGRNLVASMTEAANVPALAATTTYTYSPTGKVASLTDALGRTTRNAYGVCCDRLVSVTDPAGFVTSFAYDFVGNRTSVTDGNNLTTVTTYDARNRPVTITNAAGEITRMAYYENGNSAAGAAGLGLGAGANGSAVIVTNPLGEKTTEIRDGLGRTIRRIDGLGHATTMSYDAVVADAAGTLVASTTTDALAHTTTALADGAGRVRVTLDALNQRATAGFDAAGNRVTWRDANGVGQDCGFDARNRDTVCTDTAGSTTRKAYDANGNLVGTTDALGKIETSVYDARNRKTATTDKIGATTTFAYDAVSNLTQITDAEGGITAYRFDARNLLDREVFPAGQAGRTARFYAYDAGRRLTQRAVKAIAATGAIPDTVPAGSERTGYAYDRANRLLTRSYPDARNDSFAYDKASRLTAATSARYDNHVTRTYDQASRLTSETIAFDAADEGVELAVGYQYDADNRLTGVTYPDGTVVTRGYTARNQLAQIWDQGASQVARTYDAGGRLRTSLFGNTTKETRTYVANDNLVASIAIPGVTDFSYTYDALKRKTLERDGFAPAPAQTFGYDDQSRLTSWKQGTATANSWVLSPVGDWTQYQTTTAGATTTQARTHSDVHEVLTIGGTALAYDAKGNLTRDEQGQVFAWDFENRLRAASALKQGQGDSATYGYDALGRRIRQVVTTGAVTSPTYFVNGGAQELVAITGDLTAYNDPSADPEDAGAAPFDPATGQGARGSLLADPTAQRFNSQPASTDTPDGWQQDLGQQRATATTRGWSAVKSGVDRDHLGRPLYDSFIPLGTATTQYPVANGTHAVVIMCGDADSRAQTNHLTVNGVAVVDPTPYDGKVTLGYETGAFDGYALTVTVTNGLLTIQGGAGALNPKINFIEIGATGSAVDQATKDRVTAAALKATQDTAKPKPKTPPVEKRNVWGDYVDELVSYTVKKPRRSPVRYYTHSNHLYSSAATTNTAGQVVERYSYSAYGLRTAKNLAGATLAKSAVNQDRGFTSYRQEFETGLYFARARMYSGLQGRFVNRDPWRRRLGSASSLDGYPDGLNSYSAYFSPRGLDPRGTDDWYNDCGPCKNGAHKQADDAGEFCCPEEIATITIKQEPSDLSGLWHGVVNPGHAFLETPNDGSYGLYPKQKLGESTIFSGESYEGELKNTPNHPYDPNHSIPYRVCPATMDKIRKQIQENPKPNYSPNNYPSNNCTGWVCNVVGNAGLPLPKYSNGRTVDPNRPGLFPGELSNPGTDPQERVTLIWP